MSSDVSVIFLCSCGEEEKNNVHHYGKSYFLISSFEMYANCFQKDYIKI